MCGLEFNTENHCKNQSLFQPTTYGQLENSINVYDKHIHVAETATINAAQSNPISYLSPPMSLPVQGACGSCRRLWQTVHNITIKTLFTLKVKVWSSLQENDAKEKR